VAEWLKAAARKGCYATQVASEVRILPLSAILRIRRLRLNSEVPYTQVWKLAARKSELRTRFRESHGWRKNGLKTWRSPRCSLNALRKTEPVPDILTFWQRLPETDPKYSYRTERESIAALPITSCSHWWKKQIDSSVRNKIRKVQKKGVVIRLTDFNDELV
jgi:hypothetical protein